jgi:hypothetical protein
LDCINLEVILLITSFIVIVLANFTKARMAKNVLNEIKGNLPKPSVIQIILWEIALPKQFLTPRGLSWRKASIACCTLIIVLMILWVYLQRIEGVCSFQLVPK